jgi:hypothetical protein
MPERPAADQPQAPDTRDHTLPALLCEFARTEDLLRAEEARVFGGAKPPGNLELVRLETYERRLMAMMRVAATPDADDR